MYDLISIGDTTTDVFMELNLADTEAFCNVSDEECRISFEYGAKIPTKSLTRVPAVGNAANCAIGSSRLGLKTAIYTNLGQDHASEEAKQVFEKEGVDTAYVVMEKGKTTNFSVVLNYDAERNIFVYHEQRNYALPDMEASSWVYLTSIGKNHQSLHQEIIEYVKKNNVKLGFNPGSFQLREGLSGLAPVLAVTEVLLLNREEAHGLVDGDIEDIKDLLKRLHDTGAKTVVITDGTDGSYASFDGREVWQVGVPQTPVVERTGAGDAYSAGFIAALVHGQSLQEAMVWGTMNSTSVVQYIGAREGLLTKEKMQEFVAKYADEVKPKMI